MSRLENRKRSNFNYWLAGAGLMAVALFVPQPFNVLIFLAAIFAICWEISDRLREQYYIHESVNENLERLVELLGRTERNTEKISGYLYEKTPQYQEYLAELER